MPSDTPQTAGQPQLNPQDISNLLAAAKAGLVNLPDEACEHVSGSITRVRKVLASIQTQLAAPAPESKPAEEHG